MVIRRATRQRVITGGLFVLLGCCLLFYLSTPPTYYDNHHDHHSEFNVGEKNNQEILERKQIPTVGKAGKIEESNSMINAGKQLDFEADRKFVFENEARKPKPVPNKVGDTKGNGKISPETNMKHTQDSFKFHQKFQETTKLNVKEFALAVIEEENVAILQTTEPTGKRSNYKITSGSAENKPGQKGAFHIVQNFILYVDPDFTEPVNASQSKRANKQKELEQTLQANLNHFMISAVHIMYSHKPSLQYLENLNLTNRHKLVTVYFTDTPKISDFLQYIEDKLQNRYVIVNNQDIEIGENWDKLDLGKFREQRIMYAMSRSVKPEHMADKKCYASHVANCNPGQPDYGSADLFAFYNEGKVPPAMIKEMSYTQAKYGMENVFMWYAKWEWHYNLLNPCKHLKIYHVDCYHIDKKGRDRQKRGDHVLTVPFTDQLYFNI